MKQLFCLILALTFLLIGCSAHAEDAPGGVSFYYLHSTYQSDMRSIIEVEKRDAGGKQEDLNYLLALYLIGPSNDELISPLPGDTTIQSVRKIGSSVILRLSDTDQELTDSQFTLACACLSLTCLDLTDATEVMIHSGSRSVTMNRDNLALFDTPISATEETQ